MVQLISSLSQNVVFLIEREFNQVDIIMSTISGLTAVRLNISELDELIPKLQKSAEEKRELLANKKQVGRPRNKLP